MDAASSSTPPDSTAGSTPPSHHRQVAVTIIDSADWSSVLESQRTDLLATFPSLTNRLSVTFHRANVLDLPSPAAPCPPPLPPAAPRLTTILFTIHELFLQSRSRTLSLLAHLSSPALSTRGSLLLIVESASLSTVPIGSAGRSYPLGLLLDSALTQDKKRTTGESTTTTTPTTTTGGSASGSGSIERAKWECLRAEDEGRWYRLPQDSGQVYGAGTGANVKLENTRVVLRLYRRL
jgi:25S rRNA (uracil2843-N3)-methyltransferase